MIHPHAVIIVLFQKLVLQDDPIISCGSGRDHVHSWLLIISVLLRYVSQLYSRQIIERKTIIV